MKKFNLRHFIILFPLLLAAIHAFALHDKSDSLRQVLKTAQNDTNKVNTLLTLGEELCLSQPDTALKYFQQALILARKINFQKGIAEALGNVGYIYDQQGDPEKALEYFLQSLKIDKERNNKQGIATSLNNIGVIYDAQGNPDKALENYLQSLKILKEINDKRG
ncbi:MAG: tetratricopeptide repeat protein, partial [Bacteroidetes bacterium]|nr:tetratricopeptide repeat protein [Bacteroidota bacterium]